MLSFVESAVLSVQPDDPEPFMFVSTQGCQGCRTGMVPELRGTARGTTISGSQGHSQGLEVLFMIPPRRTIRALMVHDVAQGKQGHVHIVQAFCV